MKEHPVKNCLLWMPRTIGPFHRRRDASRNRPKFRKKQNIMILLELTGLAIKIKKGKMQGKKGVR